MGLIGGPIVWYRPGTMSPRGYDCGYCGKHTGPAQGFYSTNTKPQARIYVCTYCGAPTYFDSSGRIEAEQNQHPGAPIGNSVAHLPADLAALYNEARVTVSVHAFTSAVLTCRKLLMHVAVSKGAPEGKRFIEYVEYLAAKNYLPPDGKGWVDHIREKGNEANHEIKIMSEGDAKNLISFSEMLLKIIYEFPKRIPEPENASAKPASG